MMNAKVYLIDDDESVCRSLKAFLKRSGIETAVYHSAESFLLDWDRVQTMPGCMLIDLHLDEENGLTLLSELEKRECKMPFVMISGRGMIADVTSAMRRGAIDFLEKPFDPKILLARLEEGIEKDRQRWQQRSDDRLYTMRINSLTKREREVMDLIVQGMSTKLVAQELGIAVKTAEIHRGNLIRKMGVANTVELTRLATSYDLSPR